MEQTVRQVDELVREYLVYRGFTKSTIYFDQERENDKTCGYDVDKLISFLFETVHNYDLHTLLETWDYLETTFFQQLGGAYLPNGGHPEKVTQFFEICVERFNLLDSPNWNNWFVLPFIQSPETNPIFSTYFNKQWLETFTVSLRNFLSTVFDHIRPPRLMLFPKDRQMRETLQSELRAARTELSRLREQMTAEGLASGKISSAKSGRLGIGRERKMNVAPRLDDMSLRSKSTDYEVESNDETKRDSTPIRIHSDSISDLRSKGSVIVTTEATLNGHTGEITSARFSPATDNNSEVCLATGSRDGTVRIWDLEDESSNELTHGRRRTARLLFIGTSSRRVKIWDSESKRMVGETKVGSGTYTEVTAVQCSPNDPFFAVACASSIKGSQQRSHSLSSPGGPNAEETKGVSGVFRGLTNLTSRGRGSTLPLGIASGGSLTAWNTKTLQQQQIFRLDPAPCQTSSMAFNHNGSVLFVAGSDGMIRIFDVRGGTPLMGWPAHLGGVSDIVLSHDETSLYSVGADGRLVQWSIHGVGRALRTLELQPIFGDSMSSKSSVKLDNEGKHVLVAGGHPSSYLLSLDDWDKPSIHSVVHQSGAVSVIDWHPLKSACVTGSDAPEYDLKIHDVSLGPRQLDILQ